MSISTSFELKRSTRSSFNNPLKERSFSDDLNLLEKIVSIPSPSKNHDGVMKVQHIIAEELRALGFEINWIPSHLSSTHYLLHGFKKGTGDREITFVGHADTVLAPNSHFKFSIDLYQDKIYGPGVADDKGGLIVALRGIRNFLVNNSDHSYSLNFISSPNEEVGSLGFHQYFNKIGEGSQYVFGFEPSLANGDIISSRNGNAWYRLKVRGKAAHAGRFKEESINAAHEISRIITSLYPLNDIENKTKINVGSINGGTGHFNVVCAEATALIDMRFPNKDVRQKLHQAFVGSISNPQNACFETGNTPIIEYEIEDDCPALPYRKETNLIIKKFKDYIFEYEGKSINDTHTGGAADVNYFVADNFIIDGLGPIGGGLHTVHEFIELTSLMTRAQTLTDVLDSLNTERDHDGKYSKLSKF